LISTPPIGTAPLERTVGLDAVRTAAALMVVITHFSDRSGLSLPGNWGGNGVSVFFVLSGFLLWRPFVLGSPRISDYAISRSARILPAFWLACLILVPLRGGNLFNFLLFVPDRPIPLPVIWTLQAEVLFYLALPFLGRLRRPLAVPVVLGAISLVLDLAIAWSPYHGSAAEAWLPFRFWAFAPGMALAALAPRTDHRWLIAGLTLLLVASLTLSNNPGWGGGQWTSITAVLGAFLLVGWGTHASPIGARWWATGAGVSYALYLWHVDLIEMFGALGLPLTFLAAGASFALVETPVMNWASAFIGQSRARRGLAMAQEPPVA
jgi:peptidoglycan/LPS O-acetylase OafA/YrhL